MKMLSVQVEDTFVQEIDELVQQSGQFSSRSEFLKDAIRNNIKRVQESVAYRAKVRAAFKRLAKKAIQRGWDGKMPTPEERDRIAEEYVRKNGIKLT
jgi:Arc/MetJ-type ribon-helix-helix transcriptional regulator